MWRVVIGMMIGGGFLCFFGYREYKVSAGTSSVPAQVSLLDIEEGNIPENNYLRVGPHYRWYDACVYEYEIKKGGRGVTDDARVNHFYYPVYAVDGQFGLKVKKLLKKYGGYDRIPDNLPDDELVPIETMMMIVKTSKYKKVGKLPEGLAEEEWIEGLVVNSINTMDDEEKKLLESEFGPLDFDKILILEQGREPTSMGAAVGMMGGGVFLILAPLVVMLNKGKAKPKPPTGPATTRITPEPAAFEPVAPPITPAAPNDNDSNPYA
ncbi:MAG: hypothetical protein HN350_10890 [Phycisphaerales bacterium]|jgi:hypothetical protein|nr:hypothetical protein [Phycisphaerales bacterium]